MVDGEGEREGEGHGRSPARPVPTAHPFTSLARPVNRPRALCLTTTTKLILRNLGYIFDFTSFRYPKLPIVTR